VKPPRCEERDDSDGHDDEMQGFSRVNRAAPQTASHLVGKVTTSAMVLIDLGICGGLHNHGRHRQRTLDLLQEETNCRGERVGRRCPLLAS
jgi:hypothetical protein